VKIVGFVEGARQDSGGIGLIGVPMIHQALAARGHQELLVVAGGMISSGTPFEVGSLGFPSITLGGKRTGVFAAKSIGRWAFSSSLLEADKLVRVSDFVTLHSLYSFPVLAGYLMAKKYNKPYGLWPHGVLAPVQRRISRGRKRVYNAVVSNRILAEASILFYSASGERDETRGLGLTAPSVVIPHGVDMAPFRTLPARGAFRKAYLGGHEGPLVLYLGRLNEKKGLNILVDAAAGIVKALPDALIAIVGGAHPPSFEAQVAEWISRSPVGDRIRMLGLVDHDRKLAAFADTDVFVLPSEAENFGFAMFEAMASRVPVVVSDSLNYAPAVHQVEAGLTPPRTPEAFAEAIVTLLRNPARRRQMGDNGFRLASEFSWERCGERIETAIYCAIRRTPFPETLMAEYPV
jgi:glycosyltransferase involved in cell wall biosynthesis